MHVLFFLSKKSENFDSKNTPTIIKSVQRQIDIWYLTMTNA